MEIRPQTTSRCRKTGPWNIQTVTYTRYARALSKFPSTCNSTCQCGMLDKAICTFIQAELPAQGDTLGNLRHGKGLHTSSNGDTYKGYWRLDKRHGRGKATLATGMQYEGDWVDDKAHGCVSRRLHSVCTLWCNASLYSLLGALSQPRFQTTNTARPTLSVRKQSIDLTAWRTCMLSSHWEALAVCTATVPADSNQHVLSNGQSQSIRCISGMGALNTRTAAATKGTSSASTAGDGGGTSSREATTTRASGSTTKFRVCSHSPCRS